MSALRIPGPDGHTILVVIDDGAVGRITHSRLGIQGGGPPIVFGHHAVGESQRDRDARSRREHVARKAAG